MKAKLILERATLEMRIKELATENDNLIKQVRILKEQIEKMKCCSTCKHCCLSFLPYWCNKNNTPTHCTSKCDKWEIKEK